MAKIIDGKAVSASVRAELKAECESFYKENGYKPGLAVIIVGDDPASKVYVNNKEKGCAEVGYYSEVYRLPAETTEEELLTLIDKLNIDDKIHGILCQLPLPKHLDENEVIMRIDPTKDVDAFHPANVGRITIGNPKFLPCTPAGIMDLLEFYKKLGNIRKDLHCLKEGGYYTVSEMLSCLAFVRHDKGERVMLIANRNEHEIDYFLPPEWHNAKTLLGNEVQADKVKISGIDVAILYKKGE